MKDDHDEIFDLNTLHEYELISNDDGSVSIQDNCVLIKHNETKVVKMLPLSEDVLDALGLALVLDENAVKDTNNIKETTYTSVEQENKLLQSTVEGSEDAKVPKQDGNITIVFTEDEDELELSGSQVTSKKSTNSDKDILQWSNPMVSLLLDLYEKNQQKFYTNGYKHRYIWKEIHKEMCEKFPELLNWNETNIQSKFAGLKRTFKGALEYFKDNLHTTKWPFYERMEYLMAKNLELQHSSSEEKSHSWPSEWTHLLLDIIGKSLTETQVSDFWDEIREKAIQTEPGFGRVTVQQVQEKFSQLQNTFKLCNETGCKPKGELKDKTIYEKLSKLNEEISDDAIEDPGAGGQNMQVDLEPTDNTSPDRSTTQPCGYSEKSVDTSLTRKSKNRSRPLKSSRGVGEAWSSAATSLLLLAYSNTRRTLDETGPKFWAQLAATLKQKLPYMHVDATKCEQKIQTLFLKYKGLLRADPGLTREPRKWPHFTKMHQIFGPESVQWPDRVIELLLNLYQAQIPRLESGKNPVTIWAEISDEINKVHASEEFTADSCRKKMAELKQKYCRLLNDDEAAKAWPFHKRMSEVFTPHLWSKSNVQLLLRLYQSLSARWGRHGWQALSEQFNAASVSSVASATQCRTELRALVARYQNQLAKDGFGEAWPFFQKMHEIFGGDESKMAPLNGADDNGMELDVKVTPTPEIKPVVKEEFVWSEDATKQLLVLYVSHRHLFGKSPRRAVWLRIDRQLAKIYPLYRPGKKGHSGWLKYLEIMTKFMDIKEKRCTEKDWPFFQLMEEIFSMKNNRRESASVSEDSCDSATERLQYRLTASPVHTPTQQQSQEPNQTTDDQNLLKSILNEIKRKNNINEKRYKLMKERHESRNKQHRETTKLLHNIHVTLKDVANEEKKEMLRVLERTLEEIHK